MELYAFLGSPYTHLMVFLSFLMLYLAIDMKEHFGVPNTWSNACYFTVTTHSTTGFGDITPKTSLAKWMVTLHMLITWGVIALS